MGFWAKEGFGGFAEPTQTGISHIAALVYLRICPSAIADLLWAKAMYDAARTSEVTNFMSVTRLLSAWMGFLIEKEILQMYTYAGDFLIFASNGVCNCKGKEKRYTKEKQVQV